MGVITNGDAAQQKSKLQTLDLAQFFAHTLISGELGHAKPGTEIFQTAAERMGCGTAECIYIGDSFENDVNGAIGVGMRAVWLDREGSGPRPQKETGTFASATSGKSSTLNSYRNQRTDVGCSESNA